MEINLIENIKNIAERYCNYKFYAFGSFMNNRICYADIDILILYESAEFIKSIRKDFLNVDSHEYFHLMFLSTEEEKEIKFIEKVAAIEIKQFL